MDPIQNRNDAFGQGLGMPSSLQATAAKFRSQTTGGYKPSGSLNGMSSGQYQGTLGGLLPVDNGTAQSQYTSTMGGMFGSSNGTSADTYAVKRYFGG